ncbi:MAG: hypothetical protein E6G09_11500 [Actinobacteria bacterium]|nr:MAG: hypothetical protein E6G18_08145 [Actinomycetota bacterium]TML81965.1 MAG: hypothetical protein E6G09_11500 [Actinomycetota bacterium]
MTVSRSDRVVAWANYLLWWLFYVGLLAWGVTLDLWLFLSGHWILGGVFTAITAWWTVRVIVESGLARFARRMARLS